GLPRVECWVCFWPPGHVAQPQRGQRRLNGALQVEEVERLLTFTPGRGAPRAGERERQAVLLGGERVQRRQVHPCQLEDRHPAGVAQVRAHGFQQTSEQGRA